VMWQSFQTPHDEVAKQSIRSKVWVQLVDKPGHVPEVQFDPVLNIEPGLKVQSRFRFRFMGF